ncbi:Pr6Pr family membrane protein [Dokdonella sp.]|uniref:Pr6Pr family membrane protein n=1 Tax=Dokdonella sp. TaxID=2291710 RepID=UPI002F4213D4
MNGPFARRRIAFAVAAIAWSALALQYILLLAATWNGIGPGLGTLRYFSYFTILGNLAVALTTSAAARGGDGAWHRVFTSARVQGGTALCIAIVCAIYHVLLASTWSPRGLQLVADVALHYVVPVLYLAWWVGCVPHGRLRWTDPLRVLLFPAAFFAWSLLRGAWVHEYPYPFIDVDALGIARVLRNAGAIAVLFVGAGLLLVALDRFALRAKPERVRAE